MIYLSKGIMPWEPHADEVSVSHCGVLHKLTGLEGALWINGRRGPGSIQNAGQEAALNSMAALGIAEYYDTADNEAIYRMLSNCSICPVRIRKPFRLLNRSERRVWRWISGAGLRLTMAELVLMAERGIAPEPGLLGEENRQALTEAIYTTETICDGILETMMEKSPQRDRTVNAVLGLLRKAQIFLV